MHSNAEDSCAICSKEPQDMLLLQCSHNLCLDCATELFAASQQQSLQCEICFVKTLLDHETVQCLNSLLTLSPSSPPHPEPPLPRLPKQSKGLQCQEHREKALYFCFDCNHPNICSECILGTVHAGHKVSTIKKAAKMLLQGLAGQTRELQDIKGRLQAEAEAVRMRKEQLMGEFQEKRRKLKLIFDDMMRQVASRFNELSAELESHSQRGIEIAEGAFNATVQKVGAIDGVIGQNRETLQMSDCEAVVRRVSQMQMRLQAFKPDVPVVPPCNNLWLRQQDSVFVDLQSLLQRVSWEDSQQRQQMMPNIHIQASLMDQSCRYAYADQGESHLREKEMNQSVNRYSGIKPTSRKLQLSRSMDNATNIINKLQQRLRK